MTYLTILEKLQILFNTILNFKVVLVFTILMLIMTILYTFKVLNKKKYSLLMLISFILLFGISIISNYKILSNTFDNFMTIFFREVYFPSIYIYIAILIISIIVFITSILSKTLKKTYKTINITNFVLNNILLVTILNIIAKNKIDIFSVNSLYTNTNLVAILEISTSLFLIWFAAITITYATDIICGKITRKTRVVTVPEVIQTEVPTDIKEESNIGIITSNMTNTVIDLPEELTKKEEIVYETPTLYGEDQLSLFEKIEEPINENNTKESLSYVSEVNNEDLNKEQLSLFDENNEPISYIEEVEETKEENQTLTINDILSTIVPVEYENNNYIEKYTVVDPQEMYEEEYNINKNLMKDSEHVEETVNENILPVSNITYNEEVLDKNEDSIFSLEDYKKIAKMLREIKNYTSNNTLTVEDAINLTLVNNYSIEDCLKFKNILESNLM